MEVAWAFTLLLILAFLLLPNLNTNYQTKELLMSLSEDLTAIADQLENAKEEIAGRIGDLEGALLQAGEQPQEVVDAVAALKEVAQSLDDMTEDPAHEADPGDSAEDYTEGEEAS